jgi:LPXTG-motif cell wall-anchored protein
MPFTAIPEPSTLGLAALASGLGLVLGRRRSA